MDEGCGVLFGGLFVLVLAISLIRLAVILIWGAISAVLIGVIYAFCGVYLVLQFAATNIFAAADSIFYFDPAVPPVVSWVLGGALLGLVVQGVREVLPREDRRMPALLLLPVCLLLVWMTIQ